MRIWYEPRFDWRHPVSSLRDMWRMRRVRRVFSDQSVYYQAAEPDDRGGRIVTFQKGNK